MKKFKHWLIRKLGGYVEVAPPIISEDIIKTVKISASVSVPFEHLKHDLLRTDNRVKKELALNLGEQLINQGLCKILRSDDYKYVFGCAYFKTSILVIPPRDIL